MSYKFEHVLACVWAFEAKLTADLTAPPEEISSVNRKLLLNIPDQQLQPIAMRTWFKPFKRNNSRGADLIIYKCRETA